MNYLAHLLLSGDDPELQVGGLLGDFVKGPLKGELPSKIEQGIRLHRKLDVVTDQHPAFIEAATTVPDSWRRYRGILLDIYFDHLLASNWPHYHPQPLVDYCADFYANLNNHRAYLPQRALHFCEVAPKVNWLESYASPQHLPTMLNNVGKRLRRPQPLGQAVAALQARQDELQPLFHELINELLLLASQWRSELAEHTL